MPLQLFVDTLQRDQNTNKRDYEAEDDDESEEPQPPCKRKRKTQNIEDEDTNDKPQSFPNNASICNRESKGNDLLCEAAANGKVTMVIYNTMDFLDVLKMLPKEQIQDLTPNQCAEM